MPKTRLKDFEGKQVIMEYNSRISAINILNCKLMFVGQDSVIINIGRKELQIQKANVLKLSDLHGKLLFDK